jgi:hypothetical protein
MDISCVLQLLIGHSGLQSPKAPKPKNKTKKAETENRTRYVAPKKKISLCVLPLLEWEKLSDSCIVVSQNPKPIIYFFVI